MKKHISAAFAAAALAVLAACGSAPTAATLAAPTKAVTDEAPAPQPQDTSAQRVPNMMGSGN